MEKSHQEVGENGLQSIIDGLALNWTSYVYSCKTKNKKDIRSYVAAWIKARKMKVSN